MSDTTHLTGPETGTDAPKPPRKRHRVRNTVLVVLALGAIGGIASAASGSSTPAAAPAKPASSAPASPATPAQPATASGYLAAHGYTVVQHFSRAQWLAGLKPGTAYAKYVAVGSDVAADGIKNGSQVEFAIKVSNPAAAASATAGGTLKLDGTYLVGSTTLPTSSPSASAPAPAAPATTAPAAPATTAPAAPATTAPAAPAGPTVSQQQALDDAQSYLNMDSGFSRDGLIGQLEFDKFSAADATYAADNSGADWNAQAVYSAQGYMKLGGFSRDSLISQLEFDKYTYAQASYAASQVGL
jgi:hypothetical protein